MSIQRKIFFCMYARCFFSIKVMKQIDNIRSLSMSQSVESSFSSNPSTSTTYIYIYIQRVDRKGIKKSAFRIKTESVTMTSRSKNDADYDYLFKILIIGDSGVGYVIHFSRSNSQMIFHSLVKQRFCNDLPRIIFLMNTSRRSVLVRASFLEKK